MHIMEFEKYIQLRSNCLTDNNRKLDWRHKRDASLSQRIGQSSISSAMWVLCASQGYRNDQCMVDISSSRTSWWLDAVCCNGLSSDGATRTTVKASRRILAHYFDYEAGHATKRFIHCDHHYGREHTCLDKDVTSRHVLCVADVCRSVNLIESIREPPRQEHLDILIECYATSPWHTEPHSCPHASERSTRDPHGNAYYHCLTRESSR